VLQCWKVKAAAPRSGGAAAPVRRRALVAGPGSDRKRRNERFLKRFKATADRSDAILGRCRAPEETYILMIIDIDWRES
jgi:hypothetical protein